MNEKLNGMLIGILLTIGIFTLFGITAAHTSDSSYVKINDNAHVSHHYMMDNSNIGHGMMMNHHMDMTAKEMDHDSDGFCDMCGMHIDECLEIKEYNNMMSCHDEIK